MAAKGDYPLPKFHFQVNFEGTDGKEIRIGFTEVSGLDFETEVIEYREGRDELLTKKAQPGLKKFSHVTLKRGTFQGDHQFYLEWKKTFQFQEGNKTGGNFRHTVTITLLNKAHEPVIAWILANAWVSKHSSTDLKADGNEVAIETIELVHEGLTIDTSVG